MDNGDLGKLEETTSKYGDLEQQTKEFQFQTQNNTHRLLDMSQEVFFFLRFAEYWYMTIQNQIFINLWTISTEWHKGLSVSWGLLSSDCGPNYRHGR